MCPLSVGLKRPTGVLSFDNFKFVFDQVYPCYLNLTGIGEPFLNRDVYKIIKYAKKKRTFVKLDTNATLLTREKGIEMLNAGPDILSISMDGATKGTYEKIRIPAKWEVFYENAKNFIKLRNEMKKFDTQVHSFMVVQKHNFHELPDYIKLASEMGFDSINGTFVIRLGANKNDETGLHHLTEKEVKEVYERTKEALKEAKVPVRIENLISFLRSFEIGAEKNPVVEYAENKPCFYPWYEAYLTWDGNVSPCCFYAESEVVFGNVFKEPFMQIWNNEKAQEFRKQLVKKRLGICATCGVNEENIYNKFSFVTKVPVLKNITHRR